MVATAWAVARFRLPINLIVVTPLTENMPGPSATKPGDMYVLEYVGRRLVLTVYPAYIR